MVIPIFIAALGTLRQDRPFAFLSYKDTIFAVKQRHTWANPTYAIEPHPPGRVELEVLGLNKGVGTFWSSMEGWDRRTGCWNVACLDFDDVMGWAAEPRYLRSVRPEPSARDALRPVALRLLVEVLKPQAKPKEADALAKQVAIRGLEVYTADLDGTGTQMKIVVASGKTKDHNPAVVFLDWPASHPRVLCSSEDGWLRLLSVADLLQDGVMEVIAGGPTATGKTVAMWRYDHRRLSLLAQYPVKQ